MVKAVKIDSLSVDDCVECVYLLRK